MRSNITKYSQTLFSGFSKGPKNVGTYSHFAIYRKQSPLLNFLGQSSYGKQNYYGNHYNFTKPANSGQKVTTPPVSPLPEGRHYYEICVKDYGLSPDQQVEELSRYQKKLAEQNIRSKMVYNQDYDVYVLAILEPKEYFANEIKRILSQNPEQGQSNGNCADEWFSPGLKS